MLWTLQECRGETEALLRKHVVYAARGGWGAGLLSRLTLAPQCRQKVKEKRADAEGGVEWPGAYCPRLTATPDPLGGRGYQQCAHQSPGR